MKKSVVDSVLYILMMCFVMTLLGVRHGAITFHQFMTLIIAELTLAITVIKSTNKKGDDE